MTTISHPDSGESGAAGRARGDTREGAQRLREPFNIAPRTNVPSFITSGDYRQELTPGEIVVVVSEGRRRRDAMAG
jgi:hypothetical protein